MSPTLERTGSVQRLGRALGFRTAAAAPAGSSPGHEMSYTLTASVASQATEPVRAWGRQAAVSDLAISKFCLVPARQNRCTSRSTCDLGLTNSCPGKPGSEMESNKNQPILGSAYPKGLCNSPAPLLIPYTLMRRLRLREFTAHTGPCTVPSCLSCSKGKWLFSLCYVLTVRHFLTQGFQMLANRQEAH